MNKLKARGPWWQFVVPLKRREMFVTHGQLYGTPVPYGMGDWVSLGKLDPKWHEGIRRADYVVYSYYTPIAWHTPDGWTIPQDRYSVTTTKHRNKIDTALRRMNDAHDPDDR